MPSLEGLWPLTRLTYQAYYVNAVLSGYAEDTAGKLVPFAGFAGWHSANYPWPGAPSWVSYAFKVGEDVVDATHGDQFPAAFLIPGSNKSSELVVLGGGCSLYLPVSVRPVIEDSLTSFGLGMSHSTAILSTDARRIGAISVGPKKAYRITEVFGQAEVGNLCNLRLRKFFFQYDYLCLTEPNWGGIVETRFVSKDLKGRRGLLVKNHARHWKYLGNQQEVVELELGQEPAYKLLCEHIVNLGHYGSLRRQLVQDFSNRIGLRERFIVG